MTQTSTDRNKETIRGLYENIINERKLELLDGVIAANYEGDGGAKGPAGFRQNVRSVVDGFPDIRFTIDDLLAEGDKVVVRWTWTGTNTASFRGFPVSNKPVTNQAIVIYQLHDGKVVRSWLQSDRLGALVQIGVVPQELITPPAPRK